MRFTDHVFFVSYSGLVRQVIQYQKKPWKIKFDLLTQ